MKKVISILFLFTFLIILTNCDDKDEKITSPINLFEDMYDNIPVVVNTENTFTFTVVANDLDYSYENNLNFTRDSLVATITLTNGSSNNSYFNLLNTNDEPIFSESLNSSKVIVNTELSSEGLKSAKIELSSFSGELTIVIALKNP